MAGATRLGDLARRVLELLPAGWSGDVRVLSERWATMRFAESRLTQPHLEDGGYASLRAVHEQRIGCAATTDLSPAGLRALAATALALARVAPPDPRFPDFPRAAGPARRTSFSRSTARLPIDRAARLAASAIQGAHELQPDGRVAGFVEIGYEHLAVANSSGLARTAERSVAGASVLVDRPDLEAPVSGWDEAAHWDVGRLDPRALGRAAASLVPRGPAASAKPGRYRVLLAGPAASTVLSFLAYLGFNSRGESDGWSCLRTRRGRRVAPKAVDLLDDGTSPRSLPRAFDYEGTAKRPLWLLDGGVVGSAATDLRSAAAAGRDRTGHGPLPEAPWGEIGATPSNVLLAPGAASWDDLVAAVGNGLLVTRLHYVRVVHPTRSILTGMTRDGTYRIRHGEIAEPVRNLRFTESVLKTVAGIEAIGRVARCYSDDRGGAAVTTPPFVTGGFHFTSGTVF